MHVVFALIKRTAIVGIGIYDNECYFKTGERKTLGSDPIKNISGRLAAIEGWVHTRPVKRKSMTFYFVYPLTTISVPDTLKCS